MTSHKKTYLFILLSLGGIISGLVVSFGILIAVVQIANPGSEIEKSVAGETSPPR